MESKVYIYIIKVKDEMLSGKHELPDDYDYNDYFPFNKADVNAIAENLRGYYASQVVIDNVTINSSNLNDANDIAKKIELAKELPIKFKDIFKTLEISDFMKYFVFCSDGNRSIDIALSPDKEKLNYIPKIKAFFDLFPDLKLKYHIKFDRNSMTAVLEKALSQKFYCEFDGDFEAYIHSAERKSDVVKPLSEADVLANAIKNNKHADFGAVYPSSGPIPDNNFLLGDTFYRFDHSLADAFDDYIDKLSDLKMMQEESQDYTRAQVIKQYEEIKKAHNLFYAKLQTFKAKYQNIDMTKFEESICVNKANVTNDDINKVVQQ